MLFLNTFFWCENTFHTLRVKTKKLRGRFFIFHSAKWRKKKQNTNQQHTAFDADTVPFDRTRFFLLVCLNMVFNAIKCMRANQLSILNRYANFRLLLIRLLKNRMKFLRATSGSSVTTKMLFMRIFSVAFGKICLCMRNEFIDWICVQISETNVCDDYEFSGQHFNLYWKLPCSFLPCSFCRSNWCCERQSFFIAYIHMVVDKYENYCCRFLF